MISVRPSVRPSVRHSSVRLSVRQPLVRPSVSTFYPNPLLIMLLAGLQCSKRCQFNNCLILFCIFLSWRAKQLPRNLRQNIHGKYRAFTTPVGKIAITNCSCFFCPAYIWQSLCKDYNGMELQFIWTT